MSDRFDSAVSRRYWRQRSYAGRTPGSMGAVYGWVEAGVELDEVVAAVVGRETAKWRTTADDVDGRDSRSERSGAAEGRISQAAASVRKKRKGRVVSCWIGSSAGRAERRRARGLAPRRRSSKSTQPLCQSRHPTRMGTGRGSRSFAVKREDSLTKSMMSHPDRVKGTRKWRWNWRVVKEASRKSKGAGARWAAASTSSRSGQQ